MTFSWLFPFSTSFSNHNFGFFVCQISCHHIYCALHLQRRAVMYPRWAATPSDQVQTYFVPDVPLFKIGNPLAWPQRSHLWLSRTFHDPSPNFKTSFFCDPIYLSRTNNIPICIIHHFGPTQKSLHPVIFVFVTLTHPCHTGSYRINVILLPIHSLRHLLGLELVLPFPSIISAISSTTPRFARTCIDNPRVQSNVGYKLSTNL